MQLEIWYLGHYPSPYTLLDHYSMNAIHIFDFGGDLYDKNLKVYNIKRVPEDLTIAMYNINKRNSNETNKE